MIVIRIQENIKRGKERERKYLEEENHIKAIQVIVMNIYQLEDMKLRII